MSMGYCLVCEHCDPKRTNDLGQVRCKRFSTYVSTHDRCDYFTNKETRDFINNIKPMRITEEPIVIKASPTMKELRKIYKERREGMLKKG